MSQIGTYTAQEIVSAKFATVQSSSVVATRATVVIGGPVAQLRSDWEEWIRDILTIRDKERSKFEYRNP